MVSLRNNRSHPYTLPYAKEKGGGGKLEILPGINLNICSDEEWEIASQHPIAKTWIENGCIDVLIKNPTPKGNLAGFEVSEDRQTEEPVPIHSPDSPVNAGALGDLSVRDIKEALQETFNTDLLRQWKEQEEAGKNRTTAIAEIDARIRELENPS